MALGSGRREARKKMPPGECQGRGTIAQNSFTVSVSRIMYRNVYVPFGPGRTLRIVCFEPVAKAPLQLLQFAFSGGAVGNLNE